MKYIIQKIYQKLSDFFNKKPASIPTPNNTTSLTFELIEDSTKIDISCQLPDISTFSVEEIVILAENYANLLVRVNNGLLKKEIVKMIEDTYDNSQIEHKLLADNILVFCDLLQVEYDKQKLNMNNNPIIKPMAVFKHELSK